MDELQIGKVISFDESVGKIISETGEYLFLQEDIEEDFLIRRGRMVAFRGELVYGTKRAFFVRGAENVLMGKVKKEYKS